MVIYLVVHLVNMVDQLLVLQVTLVEMEGMLVVLWMQLVELEVLGWKSYIPHFDLLQPIQSTIH